MQTRTREETIRQADAWLSKLRRTEEDLYEESTRRTDEGEASDFWRESHRVMKQADDVQFCLERAREGQETHLDFRILEFAATANHAIESLNLMESGVQPCDAPFADSQPKA